MFRKSFLHYDPAGSAPVREPDRRRFKNIVIDSFSVTPDVAELLVPKGLLSITFKTHERISGVAYITSESVPLWFTLGKDKGDLIPTVYTLWKHPDLLPILSIPGESVPGVLHASFLLGQDTEISFRSSTPISKGKLVCMTEDYEHTAGGTPHVSPALVVARMALSSHMVEGGTRGRALTLLHAWKDQLWAMGGGANPPGLLEGSLSREVDNDEEWTDEEVEAATGTQAKGTSNEDTSKGLSPEEVSGALNSALLKSISTTLSKLPPGSFPVTPSIFYETYILPYRSSQLTNATSTPVDIKHSGFKSLTAFLKASAKEGLIKIKENKEGMVVTGVDGSHPSVQAHAHHVSIKDIEEHKGKQDEAQAHPVEVTLLWTPGPLSAPFFQRIGEDFEGLLTAEEIKTVVNQYLKSKQLFNPWDKKSVNVALDGLILDIVSDRDESMRAELLQKKFMNINKVIGKVVNSMDPWYKISSGDGQEITREGEVPLISINVVRRRGHTITYIYGFEIFRVDAERLAEELKTACATSTAIVPRFRDSSLEQIMVQGQHVQVVTERLIARGIQRRWIQVTGRKSKFKKSKRRNDPRLPRYRIRDRVVAELRVP